MRMCLPLSYYIPMCPHSLRLWYFTRLPLLPHADTSLTFGTIALLAQPRFRGTTTMDLCCSAQDTAIITRPAADSDAFCEPP